MPPNDKFIPNLPEEEQDMDLEPVVMGAGAYGSPDPVTNENVLLPAVDDPHSIGAGAAADAAKARNAEQGYKALSPDELKAEVERREISMPDEGSGKDGNLVKADYVAALEKADVDSADFDALKERAKELEIEGYSSMKKADLYEAVQKAEPSEGGANGENRVNVPRQTTGVPPAQTSTPLPANE